jgi:hypothetical protein
MVANEQVNVIGNRSKPYAAHSAACTGIIHCCFYVGRTHCCFYVGRTERVDAADTSPSVPSNVRVQLI